MRDFHELQRSVVYGTKAAVATSHTAASAVAQDVLRRGGHAVDAAIAACATLCVVEPGMTGVGGDNFTIISTRDGEVSAYNGSGRAAAGTDVDAIRARHKTTPRYDASTVTIPGAVDAWFALHERFGKLDFASLLQPAISFARHGYVVHERVAHDWAGDTGKLERDADAARVMLPNGAAPKAGDVHTQPALADTFDRMSKEGRAGFYTGAVAEDMVAKLRSLGGSHTLEDFANAQGEWVTPIQTSYRGYDLLECPANGQGIVPLIMLNILSEMDVFGGDPLSPERVHAFLEASKLAYGDRDAMLADPRHAEDTTKTVLSPAHAEAHRARIDMNRATPTPPLSMPASDDTIYISVVDDEGNAVSFINSIFENFGSGIMAPKSGVMFHNRGYSFRLEADHPNVLAPGKRPLHTIIPAMLMKDGLPVMPFGVMGGHYQGFGQAWVLSNMLDYGMNIQEAQDCARMFVYHDKVTVEKRVPQATVARLVELGHNVSVPKAPIGGSQAIWINRESNVLAAGSDPRKDGCALCL